MNIDKYGQHVYTPDDLFAHYMRNPQQHVNSVVVSTPVLFHSELELEQRPNCNTYSPSQLTLEQYDAQQQSTWLMPQSYAQLDIAQWVLDKCNTDAELQRVGEELLLYQHYEMFPLLRYLVYLVDTMRSNNIVWGVGRGSSVASYVLFLIGVHRINSMLYDLDIREFLK